MGIIKVQDDKSARDFLEVSVRVYRNDPEKQQIGSDGALSPCPKRDPSLVSPVDEVAKGVIQMIENRQHKRVFSGLGKLLFYLNRISPQLVSRVLRYQLSRFDNH